MSDPETHRDRTPPTRLIRAAAVIHSPLSDPLIHSSQSFLETYLQRMVRAVLPGQSALVELRSEAEILSELSSAACRLDLASGLLGGDHRLEPITCLAIPGLRTRPALSLSTSDPSGDLPVLTAWKSGAQPWTTSLAEAQSRLFLGPSADETASLYANVLAMDYLQRDKLELLAGTDESTSQSADKRRLDPTGGRAGWDAPLGGRGGWVSPASHPHPQLFLSSFELASQEFRGETAYRLASLLLQGLSARQAYLRRVRSFEALQESIIERVAREAPQLVPEDWQDSLSSGLKRILRQDDGDLAIPEGRARLRNCRSCSGFLEDGQHGGLSDRYCRFCADDTGALRPRSDVEGILAKWLAGWERDLTEADARDRVVGYMQAMPAWAQAS